MTASQSDGYEWTDDMDEISGFGGTYEDGCRVMVSAGMCWFDEHPDADPKFHGFRGIMGLIAEDNEDAKALSKAMIAAADSAYPTGGVTGAMHQACVAHVLRARKTNWVEYQAMMRERKRTGVTP